jgi:hypothetical protein
MTTITPVAYIQPENEIKLVSAKVERNRKMHLCPVCVEKDVETKRKKEEKENSTKNQKETVMSQESNLPTLKTPKKSDERK